MVAEQRVASLKIRTAKQRTSALLRELNRLIGKSYNSPGVAGLMSFVRFSAERLDMLLDQEVELINAGILTSAELDIRSHRVTQILPSLLRTLRFVSGAEVDGSSSQLVQPLRRYVRSILPGSDIILSSKPELNYSIQEIAALLRNTFNGTVLEECCKQLPAYLFAINIPSTEFQNVLIHAILSHEVAHGLYIRRKIADKILPNIKIDENSLKMELDRTLKVAVPPVSSAELIARQNATVEVADRITNWTEELVCDVIGIHLFGPAFYFAYTHFLLSFSRLDNASKTHPPIRLRLKLMTKVILERYRKEELRSVIADTFVQWADICSIKVQSKVIYDEFAVRTFDDPNNVRILLDGVQASLEGLDCYSGEKLAADIQEIEPLFLNLVPPGECGKFSFEQGTAIASILNIGWLVYLSRLDEFRAKLPRGKEMAESDVVAQLQELILKSLEISEIRFTYNEIMRRGSGNGKNSVPTGEPTG